jgi:hypothetical protein
MGAGREQAAKPMHLFPAVADSSHLAQLVGERQERRGSWEELASEIDTKAVAHNGHVVLVDEAGELPHLLLGKDCARHAAEGGAILRLSRRARSAAIERDLKL